MEQEPCMVVEPAKANPSTEKRKASALPQQLLPFFLVPLPQVVISCESFGNNAIPVDARHNAKIHRLSLSKKWGRFVQRAEVKAGLWP